MSALGAIVAIDGGRPVDADELEAFATVHAAVLDSVVSERKLDTSAGAFRLGSGVPRGEEDNTSWALSVGRVHGARSLLCAPLTSLDGQFALITHDGERDVTRVIVDPCGMQRLYVAARPGRLYASTSALAIARHLATEPDLLGVNTFLATGGQFGRRTLWSGVHRLDPGVAVEVVGGRRQDRVYWAPEVEEEWSRAPLAELVERHTEALTSSLRGNLPREPMLVDLTGGFDSRLLTLALRNAEVSMVTQTAGGDDDEDVVLARRIASQLGLPWRRMPRHEPSDPSQSLRAVDEAIAWGDGHLDVLQAMPVLAGFASHSREFGRVVSGGGGEHLRYYAWAQESYRAGRSNRVNFARWINLRVFSPVDLGLLRGDAVSAVRHDIEERMQPVAARYSDDLNTVQLDALYAYKSTGHFGAWASLARRHLDVELPFYWKAVFAGAFSTSYRFRNHNRLVRHMIAGLDPSIAALPTQRGGPAEPWRASNLHRFIPFYTRQARNLVPHVSNLLLGRPLPAGRPASPGEKRSTGLPETLRDAGSLDPARMRSAGLYDPVRLTDLVRRSLDPAVPPPPLLGRVITIERAFEMAGAQPISS